jgi:cysteine-rich repeat protein
MTTRRPAVRLALALSLALAPPAGARVFTVATPQPFALPGGIAGNVLPAPNVDGCGLLGGCPRDFLAFRVALDPASASIAEVRATVPDRLTMDGIGYTSSVVDRQPDGVGIVFIGDVGRWFWVTPPPLQGGERTTILVAAYAAGDLPGSVGGAFLFEDTGSVLHPGPDHVPLIESLCGNGAVDGGGGLFPETCDDGNTVDDDCCSESCVASAVGDPCSDHDACTTGELCGATTCEGGTPVTCGACEQCYTQAGCAAIPRAPAECRTSFVPGRSVLTLRDGANPRGDRASYKWLKGSVTTPSDFGQPLTDDGWDLCVFDGTGQLVLGASAPAGGTCAGRPCWKSLPGRGFLYKDRERTPNGMDVVKLEAGADGRASAVATAKGPTLTMPALGAFTFPLYVQLQGENGQCTFSAFEAANARRNDASLFHGRSTN